MGPDRTHERWARDHAAALGLFEDGPTPWPWGASMWASWRLLDRGWVKLQFDHLELLGDLKGPALRACQRVVAARVHVVQTVTVVTGPGPRDITRLDPEAFCRRRIVRAVT